MNVLNHVDVCGNLNSTILIFGGVPVEPPHYRYPYYPIDVVTRCCLLSLWCISILVISKDKPVGLRPKSPTSIILCEWCHECGIASLLITDRRIKGSVCLPPYLSRFRLFWREHDKRGGADRLKSMPVATDFTLVFVCLSNQLPTWGTIPGTNATRTSPW